MISRRSLSISRWAASDWLATEVYSPAAIENAPAARPGEAGEHDRGGVRVVAGAAGDAGDQREVGDQPVHRAEHRGPQPAARDVGVVVGDLGYVGGQRVGGHAVNVASRGRHFTEGKPHLTRCDGSGSEVGCVR